METTIFVFLFVVTLLAVIRSWKKDKKESAYFYGIISILLFVGAMFSSFVNGARLTKILADGNYYEVILAVPVPGGVETLVYAVNLDGNKKKLDKLVNYPIAGYMIEQVGERTFHLPIGTRVMRDKEGVIVIISEEGEAINVPPIVASGK